mmetsp:Transcript_112080/g.361981  ORF Transcript_112080/g.361981 Transcript_112080/m.361981 type:complete len:279 (-) Transcript_112080:177-1013(-)
MPSAVTNCCSLAQVPPCSGSEDEKTELWRRLCRSTSIVERRSRRPAERRAAKRQCKSQLRAHPNIDPQAAPRQQSSLGRRGSLFLDLVARYRLALVFNQQLRGRQQGQGANFQTIGASSVAGRTRFLHPNTILRLVDVLQAIALRPARSEGKTEGRGRSLGWLLLFRGADLAPGRSSKQIGAGQSDGPSQASVDGCLGRRHRHHGPLLALGADDGKLLLHGEGASANCTDPRIRHHNVAPLQGTPLSLVHVVSHPLRSDHARDRGERAIHLCTQAAKR